jgi:hypothetical protein
MVPPPAGLVNRKPAGTPGGFAPIPRPARRVDSSYERRDRFKLLFGPYRTPPFRYGQRVTCQVRGLVVVCGLTDASIPWPI